MDPIKHVETLEVTFWLENNDTPIILLQLFLQLIELPTNVIVTLQ